MGYAMTNSLSIKLYQSVQRTMSLDYWRSKLPVEGITEAAFSTPATNP
jgi:hypothetical protein